MTPEAKAKHLIVGTAGHVDHGKTTLIQAMTGINTDRLKEEQERGLTIDLGFASLALPSGRTVGIVDVPGHERFLKNMLAGASGVDIAMLVVAADEGVMPQTREHIDILEMLESKQGLVALTKCDAVEADWLDVVEDDLRDYLDDTFLKDAPIVRVSGVTGEGIQTLIAEIDRMADRAEARPVSGPFRLPVDRVFTMTGFGTVVTGTLVSGTMKVGDAVRILPKGLESRVRGIQVHGKKQEFAEAGSRVAVNLAGIEVAELERGDVLLPPGYLQASDAIDAFVRVLEDAPRPLTSRTRVRLHIGTAEVIARVAVLPNRGLSPILEPGTQGFVQMRLESPVVSARGDRFVLRFYSPMRLLGGGVVLDPAAPKHRASENVVERLEKKLAGDPVDIVEDALAMCEAGLAIDELARAASVSVDDAKAALEELARDGRVVRVGSRFMSQVAVRRLTEAAKNALAAYFEANPMKSSMPKEELRLRCFGISVSLKSRHTRSTGAAMDAKDFQALLTVMAAAGEVEVSEATVNLPGRVPALGEKERQLVESIEQAYKDGGVNPPLPGEVEKSFGPASRDIVALLIERGELVKIAVDMLFHKDALAQAESQLRALLQERGQMTVAEFRDLIGSSRKYVVPLLEYFDKQRVTRRVGDMRVLGR